MRRSSRQIARVSPRRAVPLLAVVLLAGACTSSGPSAAEKSAASQAAKQNAVANTDLRKAVKAIKLCAQQNEGEYPPAVKNQSGTITMLCGPVSQSIHLSHGNRLTYHPRHGGLTVKITNPAGGTAVYDKRPTPSTSASS
jgi:hypothetical protein